MSGDSLILKLLVPVAAVGPCFLVCSFLTFALMSVSKGDGAGTGGAGGVGGGGAGCKGGGGAGLDSLGLNGPIHIRFHPPYEILYIQ
tara:strand:- start:336 stop:596 length:261 start_codon:yes stop_codon:yes gene_type:complete